MSAGDYPGGRAATTLAADGWVQLDRAARVVSADDRLMALHIALGGLADGELAVPQLADLARAALRLGMRLSRPVSIAGDGVLIDLWCDCAPRADGVLLQISRWHEKPVPNPQVMPRLLRAARPRKAGDDSGYIRADRLGRVLRFVPPAGYAGSVGDAEADYVLRPLSRLLTPTPPGEADDDALPVDFAGQTVMLAQDGRAWQVELRADHGADGVVMGYDLLLLPVDEDAAEASDTPPPPPPMFDDQSLERLFGTQIGPALRQPIGRIIANAETIGSRLEGPLRADYAAYASDIASAGRHLLALVEDLADLEAIEAGGFSAAREPVDLADIARRAAGLLALKAADRSIRIDRPAEEEAMGATGEFRRVLQVLLNLLGNAINYAPDGSMIWLRLDDGPDWASVTVADQGPGLTEEERQRLFNKWERLGRSGDGGSGLGLYISRRLAQAMGGALSVDSAPGQGARFTLTLPKE
ncbi:sensor histidine kinase [Blastomonas sp.]|uniref:sensor histidine kinase n=1 Tax=Blastomonas sp. TaxID=1909299 RepID=UPI003592E91E